MKVYATLVLSASNSKERSNPWFLWKLPKVDLDINPTMEPNNCSARVSLLLKEITGIEAFDGRTGWALVKFNNLYQVNNELYIVFTSTIPEKVKINGNYEWRSLLDTFYDDMCSKLDRNILLSIGGKYETLGTTFTTK